MAINFPNNPVLDTRHTVGNVTWRWDGTTWQSSAQGGQQGGGGATVSVGDIAPTTPSLGDLWWKSDEAELKVYYSDVDSSQWVDASPDAGGGTSVIGSDTEPSNSTLGDLWWKSNEGTLKIYYTDADSSQWVDATFGGGGGGGAAVTEYSSVSAFPATDAYRAKFAYAVDTGALYYSNGSSWTNNRVVVTNDSTSSDLATLIGNMQKTYTFATADHTAGNTSQDASRKVISLTDNLGNAQEFTLGVAGDGLSISRGTNTFNDTEITLTGQVQQYTPSIVTAAPAADSIIRLTGSGFDTSTQDLTFRGIDGMLVERIDANTIGFRSPASTEYYDDDAKDAAYAALNGGTHVGIQYTYDSTNRVINSQVTATGNNNNPVVTYDLSGTSSTTNQAIVQLIPSTGTTDTIEFVGGGGTTVAWDGANTKITVSSTAPVNADWTATTGLSQISNKPTDEDFQSDWDEATTTNIRYIRNKPNLVESLGDLDNVDTSTAPNDQEVLKWVAANNQWEPKPDESGAGGATTLSALTDTVIDAANLATKTKLEYDTVTSKWINVEDTSNVIPSIGDVTATSAEIPAGGYGTLNITNGFRGYVLYKITADVESWVRIYCDPNARSYDVNRSEGNDPGPGSGVIAECRTSGPNQDVLITPGIMGFNNDNPRQPTIFVAINNRSASASAVQITLTVLKIGE